jgi:hypothetical protein
MDTILCTGREIPTARVLGNSDKIDRVTFLDI